MAERVNPAEIRLATTFGKVRPVLVLWVDDEKESCLVVALTTSRVIEPRLYIGSVTGDSRQSYVSASVSRVPTPHLTHRPPIGCVGAASMATVVAWIKAEIDL